jgi:hypothetical protein
MKVARVSILGVIDQRGQLWHPRLHLPVKTTESGPDGVLTPSATFIRAFVSPHSLDVWTLRQLLAR